MESCDQLAVAGIIEVADAWAILSLARKQTPETVHRIQEIPGPRELHAMFQSVALLFLCGGR